MLSSISASENRNEILKFLLNLILERSSDTALQEVNRLQSLRIPLSQFIPGGNSCAKQTPRFHPNSPDEEPRSVSWDTAAFLQDFHVRKSRISLAHSSVFCQRVLYKEESAGWRPLQNHLSNTPTKLLRGKLFQKLLQHHHDWHYDAKIFNKICVTGELEVSEWYAKRSCHRQSSLLQRGLIFFISNKNHIFLHFVCGIVF